MNLPVDNKTTNRIRRVFIESLALNMSPEEIAGTEKLNEVSGVDSLAALEFVSAIEKEFGIELEPDRLTLEFLTDLPTLTAYVDERREPRGSN